MSDHLAKHCRRLEDLCHGTIGVSAWHLSSMQKFSYHAEQQFDLCSTYKIPIAVCLLQKATRGELDLKTTIEVHDYDLRVGSSNSPLAQLNYDGPVLMSVLNLLQFMMQESCNSSTDLILDLIGGPPAVMQTLAEAGIEHLRVDRSILEILAAEEGIVPPPKACTIAQFQILKNQVPPEAKALAKINMQNDFRDRGSPDAMCELLAQIQNFNILQQPAAELLLRMMQRCKTGAGRIMGLLPPHTKVSHKTGTDMSFGQVSDAGIIYLPDHAGQIAIAVYAEAKQSQHVIERAIAEVARSIYDYFLNQIKALSALNQYGPK